MVVPKSEVQFALALHHTCTMFQGKNNRRKRKPNQAVDGESSGSGNTDEHPTIPLSKVQFHEHSHQSAETSNNTADATTTEGTETNQPSNDHQLVGDGGLVEPLHVADINIDAEVASLVYVVG